MSTPAGWYDDGSGRQRWWNGTAWTEHAGPAPTAGTVTVAPGAAVPPPAPAPRAPEPPAKALNIVGLVSMILAIVGTVFALIPGVFIIGWVLLPVAFVLAIVSLLLSGKGKGMGIAGLAVSIVGTILGVVVFFVTMAFVVDNALDQSGDTVVIQEHQTDEPGDDAASDSEGTRTNPVALGAVVGDDDWQVVVNSVQFAANDAIMAENPYNQPAPDGYEFILVNITTTYVGDDSGIPALLSFGYVTPDGVTIDWYDPVVLTPDPFPMTTELYTGGSVTGNIAFAVPSETAGQGTIAIGLDLLGRDTVFVAVR
ncbi:DUF2510 domain-containing protein [Microbacterium sp. BWT-B31]|uniref:DUF2510 domain-containing protein n=1 Tax=Microbacterium sp. BWT-B31 TaxID=3232072 RepID=UPI003527BDC0